MLDTTRREFIALIGGGCLRLGVKVKRAWGSSRPCRWSHSSTAHRLPATCRW
jgi:hypothetical protein